MKYIFLLPALLMLVCSCKKKYTCACETAYTYKNTSGSYSTTTFPGSNSSYSEKLSKKQATAACNHEGTAIQTNFTNAMTNEGHEPLGKGESIITTCNIH